jgi:hypothetical protein
MGEWQVLGSKADKAIDPSADLYEVTAADILLFWCSRHVEEWRRMRSIHSMY